MLMLTLPSLRRLIELGYLSTRRMKHSQSRVTNDLITVASMQAFRAEYCTIGMINHRRNRAPKLTLRDMEAAGVAPVLNEPGIRRVFRWRDMPAELSAKRITVRSATVSRCRGISVSRRVVRGCRPCHLS